MAAYDISSSIQDYLKAYNVPTTGDATSLATEPAEANIANAPNLEKLSEIVNRINQQAQSAANLARTGGSGAVDEQILGNISRMAQGYVSPETVSEAEASAAQRWGGAGFGVDTPAWQSAVRRTLGLQREALQTQAAKDYNEYLASHPSAPIYDISKSLITPEIYSTDQARRAEEALKAAQLAEQQRQYESTLGFEQQKFGEEMALKEAQLKQERENLLSQLYANAYAKMYQAPQITARYYPTSGGYTDVSRNRIQEEAQSYFAGLQRLAGRSAAARAAMAASGAMRG